LVLKAVELIKEGKEIDEILEVLEKLKRKIKLFLWTYDELEAMFNQLRHCAKKGKLESG
jgi:fatty acid-binding protein DegV